jgi:mannose-6-phosphate isomerase-like protein (cupin superfamily)
MTRGSLHRRFRDLAAVDESANDLQLKPLLAVDESAADLSITWVHIDGHHQRLRTDASTRIYVVTAGRGTITVGVEEFPVETGDVVVIPPSNPYHLAGDMTYLVLNQPGFRDGDDLYLDADDEVVGAAPATRTTPSAQEQ